jgi:lysophospholipase L1-like esterase
MSKCILIDKLTFGYLDVVWKNKNKQEILSYIDSATERRSYMFNNKEFFWPDGMHPNRKGHKVLYDAIKSKLNL